MERGATASATPNSMSDVASRPGTSTLALVIDHGDAEFASIAPACAPQTANDR